MDIHKINEQLIEEVSKTLLKLVKDQNRQGAKINSNILKEAREWIKQLSLELPQPKKETATLTLLKDLPSYDEEYTQ